MEEWVRATQYVKSGKVDSDEWSTIGDFYHNRNRNAISYEWVLPRELRVCIVRKLTNNALNVLWLTFEFIRIPLDVPIT